MQHLVNHNPNGWSDHQTQQFNNLIDHYIQPQHTPLPEEMPPYLDYADYDLVSADGSHLSDFQPPNEEEEPPPHQQNLEEAIQWLAEEQQEQEQELEGHEDAESKVEEEEEINIIEDSDDEVEQKAPRANRELKSLGIVPKSTIPREVQKLHTSYNPTYTAHET
jgi:hypothetical protein